MDKTKKFKILKYFTIATIIILLGTIASLLSNLENSVLFIGVIIATTLAIANIAILLNMNYNKEKKEEN